MDSSRVGSFSSRFLDLPKEKSLYNGAQLKSLFAYLDHGVLGNSIVSWIGACDVSFDHMVDGEDLLEQSPIRGSLMVHFIIEKFGASLSEMVAVQRLFSGMVKDLLEELSPKNQSSSQVSNPTLNSHLRRDGDDLFFCTNDGEGKLSISIATVSPVSGLVHFAVNVSNQGTPVKTSSLEDLAIEPVMFSKKMLDRAVTEFNTMILATQKVKWVR